MSVSMTILYKRLGSQGEIHLTNDDEFTLCGLRCTHPNWYTISEKPDKNPQMCVDCLEKKDAK